MNKKEVSEIKKQFKNENARFTLSRIYTRYINEDNETICENSRFFDSMDEEDKIEYYNIFKKTLGGGIGKNLLECQFKEEAYGDGMQGKLTTVLNGEMANNDDVNAIFTKITETLNLHTKHYISIAYATYDVPSEKKHKGETDDDGEDDTTFAFLICSVCLMDRTKIGLYYNNKDSAVEKSSNLDIEVQPTPIVGFMFPTFSDRASDVNNILIFTKDKKEPNITFISDVLDAKYDISCDEELSCFKEIVTEICGEDIDFDVAKNIYTQLNDIMDKNINETEQPTIGYKDVENILVNSGVDPDIAKDAGDAFETVIKDKNAQLKVVNLTDETKTSIKTAGASITIKAKNTDTISTKIVDGVKCLVIPLEENAITINNIDVQG